VVFRHTTEGRKEATLASLPTREDQGRGKSPLPPMGTVGENCLPPTDEGEVPSSLYISEDDSDTSSVVSDDPLTGDETSYVMIFNAGWRASRRRRNKGTIEDGLSFTEVVGHIQDAFRHLWIWPYLRG